MCARKNNEIAAVVDISSDIVRMRISQMYGGKISDLERLEYPINIGHDVFTTGIISSKTVSEISNIMKSFARLLKEYKISKCRVIATTAVREAKNYEFVLDQLKTQNGIDVDVLDSNYQKSQVFCEAESLIKSLGMKEEYLKSTLMVYIGTASIGIALYFEGLISFWCNLQIGCVRIYDIFREIIDRKDNINTLMDEYLWQSIGRLKEDFIGYSINNIIILGSDVHILNNILDADQINGIYRVQSEKVFSLYSMLNSFTAEKLESKFGISQRESKLIYGTLAIYVNLLNLVNAKYVITPKIELWDCAISNILCSNKDNIYRSHVKENSVSCAKMIAQREKCDINHCELVRKIANRMFDRLKKFHGLNSKNRTLLEICCYLHDCQNSAGIKNCPDNMLTVYGMNKQENRIIEFVSYLSVQEFLDLDKILMLNIYGEDKLTVAKLTVLLRIANSLDRAHAQKVENLKVSIKGKDVSVIVESDSNMVLEKWAFNQNKELFNQIFGINIKLTVKPKRMSF